MTEWTVERDRVGWSVVEYRDGERQEVRGRLYGLACITAQVLAVELRRAYARGRQDEREGIAREVFA